MKKKPDYINYENFGLGVTINMVLSFIKSYGGTYASSQNIADRTELSRKSITRSIKFLKDNGLITIDNPNSRSRVMRIVEGYRDILSSVKDTMTLKRDTVSLKRDTVTLKEDTTTHYTKVIINNNKVNNKTNTKGRNIKPSSLLNQLIQDIS
tara:strand:- start:41 stop:496 length:456 start_codon:yes stop_codon:yes gene_type:complete